MRNIYTVLAAVLLTVVLTSCFTNRSEPSRYYTLLADQQELPAELMELPQINEILYVRDARVHEAYNRRQMVRRVNATQIHYLQNHLWASSLTRGAADFVAQRARQTGIFISVEREARIPLPKFEIQLQIDKLELLPDGGNFYAAIQTRISLLNRSQNRLLYTSSENREIRLESDSPSDFSLAFQNYLYDHVDTFMAAILEILYEEG